MSETTDPRLWNVTANGAVIPGAWP
jgi:hypothetical protein